MQLNTKYRLRREKDGAFLHDTESGNLFVANESALNVCDFLNSQHTKEEIIRYLSSIYPGEVKPHEAAISEFVDVAVANGFFVNA